MNKLYNALIIIKHLGWLKSLGKDMEPIYEELFEKSKTLKDEDLTEEDLKIVEFVDQLLNDKIKWYNTDKPSN